MVHRIDTPGSVAGSFINGNPFKQVPATETGAKWLNMLQEEMIAVLDEVGITPTDSDNRQLVQAITLLAGSGGGGGLSTNERAQLNATVPFGPPIAGQGYRNLLLSSEVQELPASGGFDVPRVRTLEYALKVAHFTVPRMSMVDGGVLRVRVLGYLYPYSINPVIAVDVRHKGTGESTSTLFRPPGANANVGYSISNGNTGQWRLQRFPKPTPFELDLWIYALGRNVFRPGAWLGPNANDTGTGNTFCTGSLRFGDMLLGRGIEVAGLFSTDGGYWTSGNTYTKEQHTVESYGKVYRCCASHIAASTNQPGSGVDWRKYWRNMSVVIDIRHANQVDWTLEQEIQIGINASLCDDQDAPANWSSSAVSYTNGDYVTHTSKRWICMETHTSSTSKEPGVSDPATGKDGERYWEESTGMDVLHLDLLEAGMFGAVQGFESLI